MNIGRRSLAHYQVGGHSYELDLADPADAGAIVGLYESMDFDSLFNRFMGVFRNFEGHVARLLGDEGLGFALLGWEGGRPVAEGEAFLGGRGCAELAPIVHPAHRNRGLGSVIMALLALESYRRGARCAEVYFLFDNVPMRRIAAELGMKLEAEGNVIHGAVDAQAGSRAAREVLNRRGAVIGPTPL